MRVPISLHSYQQILFFIIIIILVNASNVLHYDFDLHFPNSMMVSIFFKKIVFFFYFHLLEMHSNRKKERALSC